MLKRTITDKDRAAVKKQHSDWLKFIALCGLAGITIGALTALLVVRYDINGFGTLLAHSSHRIGFTILLTAGFASTFGMVAMGTGIMIRSQTQEDIDV